MRQAPQNGFDSTNLVRKDVALAVPDGLGNR